MKPAGVRIIGLTGGIATGKSTVADFFRKKGAAVIDADELSRDAVAPGSRGLAQVVAAFGNAILAEDGTLDRKRLGAQVFGDRDKRRQLEAILHPEIKRLAEAAIHAAAAAGHRTVFYMAPLLIEAGVTDRVDEVWVVTLSPEVQLLRLMGRDGIGRDEALRIIATQMPLADKERYGTVVIDNSGCPEDTERVLEDIWRKEIQVNHE